MCTSLTVWSTEAGRFRLNNATQAIHTLYMYCIYSSRKVRPISYWPVSFLAVRYCDFPIWLPNSDVTFDAWSATYTCHDGHRFTDGTTRKTTTCVGTRWSDLGDECSRACTSDQLASHNITTCNPSVPLFQQSPVRLRPQSSTVTCRFRMRCGAATRCTVATRVSDSKTAMQRSSPFSAWTPGTGAVLWATAQVGFTHCYSFVT